jgi:hypothetical protein
MNLCGNVKRVTKDTPGVRVVFAEAQYVRTNRLCQSTFLQRQIPLNLTHYPSTALEV